MAFLQNDQDYLDAGVEPPEHIDHSSTDSRRIDSHIHRWHATGGYIECDGGEHIHGQPYDHLNLLLVGTSPEGSAIFKTLDLANQRKDNLNNVSPDVSNEG